MVTYQDFMKASDKTAFIKTCIETHKASSLYQTAVLADEYFRHQNRTIKLFQKLLYEMSGTAVPDRWGANFKMATNFYKRFVTQENQFLLGNGITWSQKTTRDKLGTKKKAFDTQMQKLGKLALSEAVAFGFWNYDHLEVFSVKEFAPLYDEENGALMAGVRFWQIDANKPLRATLYEVDGYTDYIWSKDRPDSNILHDKRAYKLKIRQSVADGEEIYDMENYPTFPIIPLWGYDEHQSLIAGLREQIDCYDLIKSGYANTVDEGSIIYWTLKDANCMDDVDLRKFVEKLKSLHAVNLPDGVQAENHNLEAPYQSREALLTTLRSDLYEDAMALDTKSIADGAVTATQIKAAYEPLNSKADDYEYLVRTFIDNLLDIVGIDDAPSFSRSMIVNTQEEVQVVVQSANYLEPDYVTRKLLTILGDGDLADDMITQRDADELNRSVEDEPEETE